MDGHEVVGLPADHPARVRYEETMSGRTAGTASGAPATDDSTPGQRVAAAASQQDPDDPTILHRPSAVDVTVPAAPLASDPRMLVLPSRPLEMGQCGAPVLDAFEDVVGMVESTLTAAHGKLAGAGVCVTASRLRSLIKEVEARVDAQIKGAAAADGVVPGGGSGSGGGGDGASKAVPGSLRTVPGQSAWASVGPSSPYGQRPEPRLGGSSAVPYETAMEIEDKYGSDGVRFINGPVVKGSEGTSFADAALMLYRELTQHAGEAAGLALVQARRQGASEPEGSAVASRAAWLVLAGRAQTAEEAAARAADDGRAEAGAGRVEESSPAGRWGLSPEHTARLAAVLGEDRRPAPGQSVARELAHSAALAASFAEDALATDGEALPLSHRLALAARDRGALPSWAFTLDPRNPEASWDAIGVAPPADGGRVWLAASKPGAGTALPEMPEALPDGEEAVGMAKPDSSERLQPMPRRPAMRPTRRERRTVQQQYSHSAGQHGGGERV